MSSTQPTPAPNGAVMAFTAERASVTVEIEAPVARVWRAFTVELQSWFNFFNLKGAKVYFELKPGGRFYEETPNGDSILWYWVSEIAVEQRLTLWGYMSPPSSPACHNTLMLRFVPIRDGAATRLDIEEVIQGLVRSGSAKNLEDGWNLLIGKTFRDYVERGIKPTGLPE